MKNRPDYAKFWSPAFDTMDDFIFLIDKDFHVVKVNRMLSTGKFEHSEFFEPRLKKWLYVRTTPIFDDSHIVIGSIHMAADVTQFRESEENLKRSQNLLSETGRMAKVGGWEFDVDSMKQVWTEEIFRIYELDPDHQPMVKESIGFYAPEDRSIIEEAVNDAIKYDKPFDLELRLITAKRNLRWVRAIGKAIRKNGITVKVMGTFQDITDRKLISEALRENEMKYHAIYTSSSDAIMVLDPKKGFIAGNPAAIKLFDCKNESDFISKTPASLSPEYQPDGETSVSEADKMIRIAMDKGYHAFEWIHRKVDGNDFYAAVLLNRLEIRGSAMLQATVRDITAEKELHKELEKRVASLEQFQRVTIDRELKMKELKARIKELETKLETRG
ncbi:MAG: PAS domain S-box protein [Candidatus Omnitrophica bacterium]|nr:PAS domain S-box protein [Candidatus Omnitrophota bacterium]